MKNLLIVILFMGTLANNAAYAGSRDGYYLVAFPLDSISEQRMVPILKRYFNHEFKKDIYDECSSGNSANAELAYLKKRPRSFNATLVEKAISGSNSRELNKVKKIIKNYGDSEIHDGFDALIVYRYKSGKVKFWGISSISKEKNTMAISEDYSDKNIAKAICKVLSPLPYAFGP